MTYPNHLANQRKQEVPMLLVYKADHPALICKVLKKKEQKRARGRLVRTIIKVFNKSHVRRLKDTSLYGIYSNNL